MSLLSRIAVEAARGFGMLVSTGVTTNVSASYLVVAGGGSGGALGGGGAGGYQTSTATLSTLNTYSITVGAGGAPFTGQKGNNGSNSVLSGTGIITVTSTGGGAGAGFDSPNQNGNSGGSGGGGGCGANGPLGTGGAGTSGQGFAGGNPVSASPIIGNGAGGGGASAVGSNSPGSTTGGNGGAGSSSSISGSSVTYAGGGGGGAYIYGGTGTAGTGGSGGGGNGGRNGLNPTAGTANTGGGGGASGLTSAGALNTSVAGGSGIVIISYTSATPKFVGGTITTSGGNQIHTFTSSGTLSPITPITASYLVVAGGGGGGVNSACGGGAGGLLTSSTTLYSGATYIVTVGAGGAGGVSPTAGSTAGGANGSNSSVAGTGLTTITSIGGGLGAAYTGQAGGNGGSGGGGNPGGTATAGQGYDGGSGAYSAGGGAGGLPVTVSTGNNGGPGLASSISGTSTYYAGGGGGAGDYRWTPPSSGLGGIGGGGDGSFIRGGNAGSGTPNSGGGGGASSFSASGGPSQGNGGAGGSGIVIISYAGSQQFNGGLVTTSGGNTIHTFTATGALTPLTNNLNNSLRFRSSASAYLSRTPTVNGNQQKFTWSGWVKRGQLSSEQAIIVCRTGSNAAFGRLAFTSGDVLQFFARNSSSTTTALLNTTPVYRDPSAWYHIVLSVDTTQATTADRIKFYVNGNQVTAFSTATYPTQNTNLEFNTTSDTYIGVEIPNANYFDGYMTDINFIDGQALEPYYFGNNDANGVWKPIQYKGTYGTNGFYLTFGNTTSTTTLGYDSSPNGNNWTCNNISLTAGTTYDAMLDVPTNTSATAANYCVANPLDKVSADSTSQGNLLVTVNGGAASGVRCNTVNFTSITGKWYWEGTVTADSVGRTMFSMKAEPCNISSGVSSLTWYWRADGVTNLTGVGTFTTNDVIMFAYDSDTGKMWAGKNGTWLNSGVPASGTGQVTTLTALAAYALALSCDTGGAGTGAVAFNYGQRPFSYTPPTGFNRVNTYNLPTPTILQGNKYMDATTYTGNGSTQVVVNNAQFKPDFVWIKDRTSANYHGLFDSIRGAGYALYSNGTFTESAFNAQTLQSFNSNGMTVGSNGDFNTNTNNYVGWQWQAGQGSTSSNTSGSITSTVSVNTTAGFSIVTYTGTGANATVGHGLGVAPAMYIVKQRSATGDWFVYHKNGNASPQGGALFLNLTNAWTANTGYWNNTQPTSSVFSIGVAGGLNANGVTQVAYCFAEIAGFSKFGSYTGNGSADGPFVFTNFRPKYVMVKRTDSSDDWIVIDSARNTYNVANSSLFPNGSYSETTDSNRQEDLLSNGFKIRSSGVYLNASGGTYIFMAFAEHPAKISNAR